MTMTPSLDETTTNAPLSVALRTSTAEAHEAAEHSSFMDDLIGGRLDKAAFTRLQEQSWHFYKAMEEAARDLKDDMGDIYDVVLERLGTLEHDIAELGGTVDAPILPATQEYVDRLKAIHDAKAAHRLVAHHYVRYLGDLSGGQVIGRMMQRHYDVSEEATTFYDFPFKRKPYKDKYRESLDALSLTEEQRAELLQEASDAFIFNQRVFQDLETA
ncbi:MAG: biliverdin-producing heme oxygenase [Corynebacterium sp.]|nr:biliverdin-producing heme oxygenase [Corynebacterium sp.]